MKPFFFAVLLVCAVLLAEPALATVQQGVIQTGDGDSAVQVGGDAFIHVNKAYVKETNTQYNSITYEAPQQNPSTSYLSTGDVAYTRLVYPDRIAVIRIPMNVSSIEVHSGTPIALYTISSDYVDIVHGSQAVPDYNDIYDRMDHGTAAWESWIPYYTTEETIGIPSTADYLVIDNRNIFTSYNLVTIIPHPIEQKQSY